MIEQYRKCIYSLINYKQFTNYGNTLRKKVWDNGLFAGV